MLKGLSALSGISGMAGGISPPPPPPPDPPGQPTGLAVGMWSRMSGNSYIVDLSWSAPSGGETVTSYVVNGSDTGSTTTSATVTMDANAVASVVSRGAGGDSSAAQVTFTPEPGPPTGGSAVVATDHGDGTYDITVIWSAPSHGGTPTGYKVDGSPLGLVFSNNYGPVPPNTTYQVVATNTAGDSSALPITFNP